MSAQYRIDVRTLSGTKIAEITEYQRLNYVRRRNQPGECAFTLNDLSSKIALFSDDCFIEIWRKNTNFGLNWYPDFYGIYRAEERELEKIGIFTAYAPGILDLLNDRIVAYPPRTTNRSEFTSKPAETILHTLVKYNATASGTTADGRIRLATVPGISVGTDLARGPTVAYWECAEQPLLETMYDLATQYKVAFDITNIGISSWRWDYIVNTDVSDSQVFSIARNNVRRIRYTRDRRNERTVAIIGGKGEGTLKEYDIRTGANYNVSSNNREMYVNASSAESLDETYMEGDRELSDKEARPEIEFEVMQTNSSYYGVHYNLNHLVTGQYRGTDYLLVVTEVAVSVTSIAEEIQVTLMDV